MQEDTHMEDAGTAVKRQRELALMEVLIQDQRQP